MRSLILSSALLAATLIGAPQAAVAQTTSGKPFCLQSPTGDLLCNYDTMAQCQEGIQGRSVGGGCIPNPRLGTTGTGGMDAPRGSGPNSMDRVPQR
jgi:hypothetical protein